MIDIIITAFASYIATILLTESYVFERPRDWFNRLMPAGITEDYVFIECFICVAFYVTTAIGLLMHLPFIHLIAAYGLTYAIYLHGYE